MEKLLEINWSEEQMTRWELFKEGDNKCRIIFTETIDESFALDYVPADHGYLDFLSLVLDGKKVPSNILEEWNEISKEATEKYETRLKQAR